jgi:hypothetical protein
LVLIVEIKGYRGAICATSRAIFAKKMPDRSTICCGSLLLKTNCVRPGSSQIIFAMIIAKTKAI